MADWERGDITDHAIRFKLEQIIRTAYTASAAVAAAAAENAAELPTWKAKYTATTPYLQELVKDIRRNLRVYKKSDRSEKTRRSTVLRMQHSAGVAAQRGYTDALIESYEGLAKLGYELRKFWLANFNNHTPCPSCRELHGKWVGLHENFKITVKGPKIYVNLQGPPRHPRCQCWLAILIIDLANRDEEIDVEAPRGEETTMTSDEVKKIPKRLFAKLVANLAKILKFLRRKR